MSKIRLDLNRIYNDKKELGKITQLEVARHLGCLQGTVSNYLSGNRGMSEVVIEKFCEALGVTLADLERWNPELAQTPRPAEGMEPKELGDTHARLDSLYAADLDLFRAEAARIGKLVEAAELSASSRHQETEPKSVSGF